MKLHITEEELEKQRLWNHWNEKRSFLLFEGVWLERGCIPPKSFDESAKAELIRRSTELFMNEDNDYDLLYASLCTDKTHGKEWSGYGYENALDKRIERELFYKHWNDCKLPSRNKFGKPKPREDLSPRERDSLLKLIVGMAMKKYKFNPIKGKRSSAASLIKDTLIEYNIPLDDQTILDYLREGALLLPDEIRD
ncbi:MAG: hypothetical protein K0R24_635 [Gammaproteobacteria bacterium]|jgi:hypothetical protein|nr:hypothetical protein [Gammaproteobacteria bacterium]